ncbi:uracil-DNA glycosylase-like protein [Pilobolus umbonatus]|nr:uracil-DNA glycosylase-like protein [Pilobolus umbonatus]
MSKRRIEEEKTTSNKRQAVLTSMFKPLVKKEEEVKVESLTVKKDPRQLLKDVDEKTMKLLELEIATMNYDWFKVLLPEFTKEYFLKVKKYLNEELADKKTIFPPLNQVYSWSNYTPPSNVKIVILGQDPYHNHNQAHGLSFSVIKGVRVPPSLANMYIGLKKDYPEFVVPKHGYLEEWAKQGVLLLNTSLTVEAHKAGSHSQIGWEKFTDAIIKYLSDNKANIVFILWGAHSQKKGSRIDSSKHLVLKGVHPSPLSAHRGFFELQHFKKANEYLSSQGRETINWNCL